MAKKKVVSKKEEDSTGVFVPGGLLVGIGLGFVYGNIPAGTLIGLGVGFLLMGTIKLIKK